MDKRKNVQKNDSMIRVLVPNELNISETDITKKEAVAFSTWVRALIQNWRQGTVGCKGRSDVSFSNKKPWKQKGTGRARAGSARSPLWRGGGVIFGPQKRDRVLKVTKQSKKNVLTALLNKFLKNDKLVCGQWALAGDKPKTAEAYSFLRQVGLLGKRILVLLPVDDMIHYASFSNIPHVNIVSFDQVNAYDIANTDYWLILEKDLEQFKEVVSKWS